MTGNLLINLKQIIRDTLLSQCMAISTVYSTTYIIDQEALVIIYTDKYIIFVHTYVDAFTLAFF